MQTWLGLTDVISWWWDRSLRFHQLHFLVLKASSRTWKVALYSKATEVCFSTVHHVMIMTQIHRMMTKVDGEKSSSLGRRLGKEHPSCCCCRVQPPDQCSCCYRATALQQWKAKTLQKNSPWPKRFVALRLLRHAKITRLPRLRIELRTLGLWDLRDYQLRHHGMHLKAKDNFMNCNN